MKKKLRQYGCLFIGIAVYYFVHEGAHLLYALSIGTFRQINFMGLGIQIEVYDYLMSTSQLFIFCFIGVLSSQLVGYILLLLPYKSAIKYYTTLVLLVADPLYLSLLHLFVGGGDMNGISLFISKSSASLLFGVLLVLNLLIFHKKKSDLYELGRK